LPFLIDQFCFEFEKNDQSLDKMSIRVGLSAIKNVGDAAIENIINERNENGPFVNFNDFCIRVDSQKVNKRVLESLIKVGAFDKFGERNAILASIDEIRNKCGKLNDNKNSGQSSLFDNTEWRLSILECSHTSIGKDTLEDGKEHHKSQREVGKIFENISKLP
jgi:DNA polymerase III alpha subunit